MTFTYSLKQDNMIVATVEAPTEEEARKHINHYALMYSQDGDVEIIEGDGLSEDERKELEEEMDDDNTKEK